MVHVGVVDEFKLGFDNFESIDLAHQLFVWSIRISLRLSVYCDTSVHEAE